MKPDWSKAPQWAGYAAQELSGSFYWHETRPRFQELTGEWISKGQREIIPKVELRAQDTLEARPQYRGVYQTVWMHPDAIDIPYDPHWKAPG